MKNKAFSDTCEPAPVRKGGPRRKGAELRFRHDTAFSHGKSAPPRATNAFFLRKSPPAGSPQENAAPLDAFLRA